MSNSPGRAGPEVEVVIPTRDRPDQLAVTLKALAAQHFTAFGVIVVDDGGVTPAEPLATIPGPMAIRFVRNESSIGPGASRNRGVEASRAPYVVFLDDDCVAGPDLVGRHRAVLASADGPVVSLGPILSPPGQRLPVWTQWDADRLQREYTRIGRAESTANWTHLYTGNAGVRRADFLAVGGFDTRFSRQEDVELGYRLARHGCRFVFDESALVWHDSNRSLSAWTRIPAASAHFDVLMDQLDPDSARLAQVRDGLSDRHWALRVARRAGRTPLAHRCAVTGAIGAGRLLHAVRADRAALCAFSLVWDLTYSRTLREATAAGPLTRSAA
jgi:GT2 family glycosyltransferase